jgi:hypothetical protein
MVSRPVSTQPLASSPLRQPLCSGFPSVLLTTNFCAARTSRLIAEGHYYATLSYGGVVEVSEIKALAWKAVLAALNPSPFLWLAMFADELAMTDTGLETNPSTLRDVPTSRQNQSVKRKE